MSEIQRLYRIRHLQVIPDYPIRVEQIGDGAAPLGYAAMLWPDELHAQPLGTYLRSDSIPEGYTVEECFAYAYRAILGQLVPDFPTFNIHQRADFSLFLEPFQRAALHHDIGDVCHWIDAGFLEH